MRCNVQSWRVDRLPPTGVEPFAIVRQAPVNETWPNEIGAPHWLIAKRGPTNVAMPPLIATLRSRIVVQEPASAHSQNEIARLRRTIAKYPRRSETPRPWTA